MFGNPFFPQIMSIDKALDFQFEKEFQGNNIWYIYRGFYQNPKLFYRPKKKKNFI